MVCRTNAKWTPQSRSGILVLFAAAMAGAMWHCNLFPLPLPDPYTWLFHEKSFTPSHNASNLLKIRRLCVNPSIFNHSQQGRARTRFHDGRECLVFQILHSCMSWQWAGNTPIMNVWMIFRGSKIRIYIGCSAFDVPSQTLHKPFTLRPTAWQCFTAWTFLPHPLPILSVMSVTWLPCIAACA